jgi:hypothetical protein
MIVAVFICLTLCFPVNGHAEGLGRTPPVFYSAHEATVVSVGLVGSSIVFNLLVAASVNPMYYRAPAASADRMLAIAIAARSNSRTIRIWKNDVISIGGDNPATATLLYGMELE